MNCHIRVIFMEDHIPIRPDRSLLIGRQTPKWSLRAMVFHENNSTCLYHLQLYSWFRLCKWFFTETSFAHYSLPFTSTSLMVKKMVTASHHRISQFCFGFDMAKFFYEINIANCKVKEVSWKFFLDIYINSWPTVST